MKTATATWIKYNNYGTLLQAYALQRYVEALGNENEILDDKTILAEYRAAHPRTPKPKPEAPAADGDSRIRSLLHSPRRIGRVLAAHFDRETYTFPYYAAEKSCEDFKRSELNIREGVCGESLHGLNDDYDAFLCGSDQVWSVFDDIFNPYYFLDFAEKKKIAYAPSLGTDKIPTATAEKIKALLTDFSAVSVREKVSAEQLTELTGKEVSWVCDPTILHDRVFWSDFCEGVNKPRGRYLLCYFLENRPWYFARAKELAERLHLKLRLVPQKWDYLSNPDIVKYAVGPKEFVALIKNADFVLTDSYHGSIFSLLFERDFLYLQRFSEDDPGSQNIRIKSLFGYLGIEDRILGGEDTEPGKLSVDNYDKISERLKLFREKSQRYLENSLSDE